MRRLVGFLMPDRIRTQIAMLVVVALAVAQAVMMTGFLLFERQLPSPGEAFRTIERLRILAEMVDAETEKEPRTALIAAARRIDPDLQMLREPPAADVSSSSMLHRPYGWSQRRNEGSTLYISRRSGAFEQVPLLVVARLADGTALATSLPPPPAPFRLPSPGTIAALVALASVIMILSFWAARQLTSPLARFAETADQFTSGASGVAMKEDGPLEIRRAARALNDMQGRVIKLIADRTRMLAAVSHDLRTPMTRLRLRAEEIQDAGLRAKVIDDLSMMQKLVGSALAFLGGQAGRPQKVKTDLSSLVQTVCDGFTDAAGRIALRENSRPSVMCDPDDLMRAIANLIENGLKFGKSVDIDVSVDGPNVLVDVCDDGPGIPDAEKTRVFEPFYRGDAARNLNNGEGFGLGLSIAQSLVERNGGSLKLLDRPSYGLTARIELARNISTEVDSRRWAVSPQRTAFTNK